MANENEEKRFIKLFEKNLKFYQNKKERLLNTVEAMPRTEILEARRRIIYSAIDTLNGNIESTLEAIHILEGAISEEGNASPSSEKGECGMTDYDISLIEGGMTDAERKMAHRKF